MVIFLQLATVASITKDTRVFHKGLNVLKVLNAFATPQHQHSAPREASARLAQKNPPPSELTRKRIVRGDFKAHEKGGSAVYRT